MGRGQNPVGQMSNSRDARKTQKHEKQEQIQMLCFPRTAEVNSSKGFRGIDQRREGCRVGGGIGLGGSRPARLHSSSDENHFWGGEGEKNGGSRPTPANHRPPGSATLVLQPRCVCNQPFSQEMRLAICFTNRALLALRKAKEPPESRGITPAHFF